MNGTYTDIARLKAMEQNMVSCEVAAAALGMSPMSLRLQARQRPDLLLAPVNVYGSRVTVPRLPLIRALEGLESVPTNQLLAEVLRRLPAGAMEQEMLRRAQEEGGEENAD